MKRVKELQAAFHKVDVSYRLPSERDVATIARLDASPLFPRLKASWRLVGDRVCYRDGIPIDMGFRIFLDDPGTIVAALVQAKHLPTVACHIYSFAPDAEYSTVPYEYRGLALGPHLRLAEAEWTPDFDSVLKLHHEAVRDAKDLLTLSSADDVVAQWRRFFQRSVEWRDSQETVALFEADALSLAGGNQRIAKRIAKRLKQELPSARMRPQAR